jgi:hypothetical protein
VHDALLPLLGVAWVGVIVSLLSLCRAAACADRAPGGREPRTGVDARLSADEQGPESLALIGGCTPCPARAVVGGVRVSDRRSR